MPMSRCFVLLFFLLLPAPLQAQPSAQLPEDELAAMEIEPPLPLPEQKPRWPIAAGAALLLGGGLLALYLRKRKRRPLPAPLAHETALLRLAQAETFAAADNCPAFAELFDQTLRRYLEERFGVAALRQTAGELISLVTDEKAEMPEPLRAHSDKLRTWLELCEAAKFAGAALTPAEMTEMAAQLRALVEATKTEPSAALRQLQMPQRAS
jgi:LPXTG-motif cell wall-anchored protein